jgi:hypothetical protein
MRLPHIVLHELHANLHYATTETKHTQASKRAAAPLKKDALAQTNKPTNACPSFLRVRALCKCKMWFILLYFTPNERRIRAPAQHWFKMQKILLKAVSESAPRLRSARKNSSCSHAQLKTQSVTQKSSPMQLPRIWRHESTRGGKLLLKWLH